MGLDPLSTLDKTAKICYTTRSFDLFQLTLLDCDYVQLAPTFNPTKGETMAKARRKDNANQLRISMDIPMITRNVPAPTFTGVPNQLWFTNERSLVRTFLQLNLLERVRIRPDRIECFAITDMPVRIKRARDMQGRLHRAAIRQKWSGVPDRLYYLVGRAEDLDESLVKMLMADAREQLYENKTGEIELVEIDLFYTVGDAENTERLRINNVIALRAKNPNRMTELLLNKYPLCVCGDLQDKEGRVVISELWFEDVAAYYLFTLGLFEEYAISVPLEDSILHS